MTKSPHEIVQDEIVTLRITQDDIREAERYGIDHPIIYALQRATSTLWRISDCGVALEVTPPYRSCVIDAEVLRYLRDHRSSYNMPAYEFQVELKWPNSISGAPIAAPITQ